jgi:hypothetical protein
VRSGPKESARGFQSSGRARSEREEGALSGAAGYDNGQGGKEGAGPEKRTRRRWEVLSDEGASGGSLDRGLWRGSPHEFGGAWSIGRVRRRHCEQGDGWDLSSAEVRVDMWVGWQRTRLTATGMRGRSVLIRCHASEGVTGSAERSEGEAKGEGFDTGKRVRGFPLIRLVALAIPLTL